MTSPSKPTLIGAFQALLAAACLCGSATAAPVSFHFTDDRDSTNSYQSAATLTLDDRTVNGLGSGVLFTLEATLSDGIFSAGSKISDLAFNGPNGTFNNFSASAYAAFRGDVVVDVMTYTNGDGKSVGGIKFNWTDNGTAFDTSGTNPFGNGKTSTWFIGGTSVAQFGAAEFLNPFAALHVNGRTNGNSIWLLDGPTVTTASAEMAPGAVPEPQSAALLLAGLGLMGWMRRRGSTTAP